MREGGEWSVESGEMEGSMEREKGHGSYGGIGEEEE